MGRRRSGIAAVGCHMRIIAIIFIALVAGCAAPKYNRTYRASQRVSAARMELAPQTVFDDVPPLNITTNYNSVPPTIIAWCQPTTGAFIFEATTNHIDWWRLSEQFSA